MKKWVVNHMRSLAAWDRVLSAYLTLPEHARWSRRAAALGAHLGDSWLWLLVAAIALLLGDGSVRRWVLITLLAVVLSVSVTMLLKALIHRPRPQRHRGFYSSSTSDRYSFPSGHATRMASIAVIVGSRSSWAAAILYPWAVLVSLCRVLLGLHYLGDIVVGFIIGLVCSWLLLTVVQ